MCDDMSATSGNSPVSGVHWYSSPPMVSLVQTWTYAASLESFHVSCAGTYVNFLSSEDAATFTAQYLPASLIDFFDHSPVLT